MIIDKIVPASFNSSYEVTKARIFVSILLTCIFAQSAIWAYISISPELTAYFPFGTAIMFYFAVLGIFYLSKSLFLAVNVSLAFLFYQYASLSLTTGGIYSTETFFLCLIPIAALILLRAGSAFFWFVALILWSFYLFTQSNTLEQVQFFKDQISGYEPKYYLVYHISRAIGLFIIVYIFYYQNQKLLKRLEDNQTALQLKNVEHERLNDELRLTQERLEYSNKELEQYAYTTSHDLKQPIRTINSFSRLLKKNLEKREVLDTQSNEFLNFISTGTKNMQDLVTDLLDYAKLSASKDIPMKTLKLNDVLDKVLGGLKNQIDTNQVSIIRNDLPTVDAVPTKIDQVFQNIISNAIKFKKKDQPLTIKISSEKKENTWELSIEDNGIGIDEENQNRIFSPFEKLHSKYEYEGSGIGLATCKKIIEIHNGKIWVESELNKGTTFVFTLPDGQSYQR